MLFLEFNGYSEMFLPPKQIKTFQTLDRLSKLADCNLENL